MPKKKIFYSNKKKSFFISNFNPFKCLKTTSNQKSFFLFKYVCHFPFIWHPGDLYQGTAIGRLRRDMIMGIKIPSSFILTSRNVNWWIGPGCVQTSPPLQNCWEILNIIGFLGLIKDLIFGQFYSSLFVIKKNTLSPNSTLVGKNSQNCQNMGFPTNAE